MSTIVYLANQQIQVVSGKPGNNKITLNSCVSGVAPEGSMINGMIMDQDLFIEYMRQFWVMNSLPTKDVYLVINSTKFIGKKIELPILSKKKTDEFIEREFSDIRRDNDFIYGYIPIGAEGKMRNVYAEAITPDFIKDYIDIFKEFGVKLDGVYSGESSLISLVNATIGRRTKTFVLEIADSMTLTTVLFVNGAFYYLNSVRCFHEMGSLEYANDVARSVSQIIQFMQAHQIEFQLEDIVLAGINPYNFNIYQEAIFQMGIQIPVHIFEDSNIYAPNQDIQSFLRAASGLVINGNNQNYLKIYEKSFKKDKKDSGVAEILKNLVGVGIVLAIMLIALAVAVTVRYAKKKELNEIKDYNESPAIILETARYDVLVARNGFLSAQYNAILDIDDNLHTYPICDSKLIAKIQKCAGSYAIVEFSAFDADQGSVSMTAKSGTVEEINMFIKALMNEEIFADVNYTGYTYDEAEEMWNINVTCILAESAGR